MAGVAYPAAAGIDAVGQKVGLLGDRMRDSKYAAGCANSLATVAVHAGTASRRGPPMETGWKSNHGEFMLTKDGHWLLLSDDANSMRLQPDVGRWSWVVWIGTSVYRVPTVFRNADRTSVLGYQFCEAPGRPDKHGPPASRQSADLRFPRISSTVSTASIRKGLDSWQDLRFSTLRICISVAAARPSQRKPHAGLPRRPPPNSPTAMPVLSL